MNAFLNWNGTPIDQVVLAFVVSWFIELLKKSKAPFLAWITPDSSSGFLKFISALGAALTAAGMGYTWEPATGTLTVLGLTWGALAIFIQNFAGQWVLQHIVYKLVLRKPAPGV